MNRVLFNISTALIAFVLIFALFVGNTATNASAQAKTSDGMQKSSAQPCLLYTSDAADE